MYLPPTHPLDEIKAVQKKETNASTRPLPLTIRRTMIGPLFKRASIIVFSARGKASIRLSSMMSLNIPLIDSRIMPSRLESSSISFSRLRHLPRCVMKKMESQILFSITQPEYGVCVQNRSLQSTKADQGKRKNFSCAHDSIGNCLPCACAWKVKAGVLVKFETHLGYRVGPFRAPSKCACETSPPLGSFLPIASFPGKLRRYFPGVLCSLWPAHLFAELDRDWFRLSF